MKRTVYVLAVAMMSGAAWAQNPDAIDNVRSTMKSVQQKQDNDMKPVLAAAGMSTEPTKPSPVPAGAASAAAPKQASPAPAQKPAAKPVLQQTAAKSPASSSASSPVKTSFPAKTAATASSSAKNAPASSAKNSAPATTASSKTAAGGKTAVAAKDPMVTRAPAAAKAAIVAKTPITAKAEVKPAVPAAVTTAAGDASKKADAAKADAAKAEAAKADAAKAEEKKWAMTGKRDPFFSPVVAQNGGSGCSTGKKCLEIGQINLRGIVKSGGGFIAVVTNSLDKAYFLRENDPVFNGYVVRITGDSVVFQETIQDKLGKPFVREVVKKIFTPAV